MIINTNGVISLVDLQVHAITGTRDGRKYSNFSFQFEESTKKGILRGPIGSIFEIKFPEHDIKGYAI